MRKWIQKAVRRMERKGTKGSLRAYAQRRGIIKKGERLNASALTKLNRIAERTGNTALKKKVNFARNIMKRRHS